MRAGIFGNNLNLGYFIASLLPRFRFGLADGGDTLLLDDASAVDYVDDTIQLGRRRLVNDWQHAIECAGLLEF